MARPPLPPGPFLVVGLARSGRAVAAVLRALGEQVAGCDSGAVDGAVLAELQSAGMVVRAPSDGLELLDGVVTVVKSPGVPQDAPVVRAARERGLLVLGELEIGWRLLPNDVIAITGSNGKTTTTELVGEIHREAKLPVAVAGNVGTALSSLAGTLDPAAVVVCEASSFQLEDTIAFAPDAAVLLNLTPDHLDRHGSFGAYRDAKLRIFANQEPDAIAVVPAGMAYAGSARRVEFRSPMQPSYEPGLATGDGPGAPGTGRDGPGQPGTAGDGPGRPGIAGDAPRKRGTAGNGPGAAAQAGAPELAIHDGSLAWLGEPVIAVADIRLRGAHNLENAMAAAAVTLARGVDPAAVRAALASFAGVAHRLEEVAWRGGVLYVDDSKATNVASAVVGIRSFPHGVHAILGGRGKREDYGPLAAAVSERCAAAYLIGEEATRLRDTLAAAGVPLHDCGDLEAALARARATAVPGDVVLLSPACASYDQYRSFEQRGEHFKALVRGSPARA